MSSTTRTQSPVPRMFGVAAALLVLAACSEQPAPLAPARPSAAGASRPNAVPSRGRIVVSSTVTGDFELYAMNEDGSGLSRLTYHRGLDYRPSFSPDGRKIVFVRQTDTITTVGELFVMNADGSGAKQLTSFGQPVAFFGTPAWSPDGKKIAFGKIGTGTGVAEYDIFVINTNGGGLVQLTSTPSVDDEPAWSPDGTKIAYTSRGGDPSAVAQVYIMNADGTGSTPLTSCIGDCYQPDWSPDGRIILYRSNGDGQLHRHNLVENWDAPFAPGGLGPAWSPDGVKIVYMVFDGQNGKLYTANADGSLPTPISQIYTNADADWARVP